ncbi:MAG: hypothetical protein HY718_13200, partial [Planctomycetes bacterium]|nr:hypothetical protein [Planctomycetota bacterium]
LPLALHLSLGQNGRLIDTVTWGGPRMEPIFTYPTAQPGKLIGQGAGYKEWNRTGSLDIITLAGVGMAQMPNGAGGYTAGLGEVPVAEGQIDVSALPDGTYVLKAIPGNGNHVLRGDLNMLAATNRPAFAVAVNETTGGTISFTLGSVPPCTGVKARKIFYNQSAWDGNNAAINTSDFNAIAPDKSPLLPGGGAATFANYISYDKRINGIIVDACSFNRLPVLDQDLFFVMGNNLDDPFTWTDIPAAPNAMQLFPGQGVDGSDRLVMTWANGAIPNTRWLLVALFAGDGSLGLPADDFFIFGVAVGEGDGNFIVTPSDEIGARLNPHTPLNPAPIDDVWDFNRDKLVSPADQIISRTNRTTPLNQLKQISW